MTISIVLSTYNGERYIIEQLDSIRNQTKEIDEVLICDDKSTDNTVNVIKRYVERYDLKNWVLTENKENIGWRENFMQGIWKSSGDYVFTCDQDDIWNQDKIELMSSILDEHPEIEVLTCKYIEFYSDGRRITCPEIIDGTIKKQNISNNIFKIPYPGCTFALTRSIVGKSKSIWNKKFPHDALFWRMAVFSDSLYTVNMPLIEMRKHYDSSYTLESIKLKTKHSKKKWIDYAIETVEALRDYVKSNENINNLNEKQVILDKNYRWLMIRSKFYDNKSVLSGLKLCKYLDCYPSKRQYLGDWYLIFCKGEK